MAYFHVDSAYPAVRRSVRRSGLVRCSALGIVCYFGPGAGTDYYYSQYVSQKLGSVADHGDQVVVAAKGWGLSSCFGSGPKCGQAPVPQIAASISELQSRPSPFKRHCVLIYVRVTSRGRAPSQSVPPVSSGSSHARKFEPAEIQIRR